MRKAPLLPAFFTVVRNLSGISFLLESLADKICNFLFVFDNEYAHQSQVIFQNLVLNRHALENTLRRLEACGVDGEKAWLGHFFDGVA